MTHSADHVDDSFLSALVDDQLSPADQAPVLAHLGTCSECAQRLDELRSVVALLRSLPDVEPPRDFALGPRLLVDPPNVIRLRRWYTVARTSAASLAAVFVLLSVGTLYIDTRPISPSASDFAARTANTSENGPAAAPQAATPAARSAAPALAPQPKVQAPAAAAGARAAASPQADDQVAAATSIRPLPTPVPTPLPTALPPIAARPETVAPPDTAAPLRFGALVVGTLAVLALLAALIVRHRLRQSAAQF